MALYVVRARPGAPVAVLLHFDEVAEGRAWLEQPYQGWLRLA